MKIAFHFAKSLQFIVRIRICHCKIRNKNTHIISPDTMAFQIYHLFVPIRMMFQRPKHRRTIHTDEKNLFETRTMNTYLIFYPWDECIQCIETIPSNISSGAHKHY